MPRGRTFMYFSLTMSARCCVMRSVKAAAPSVASQPLPMMVAMPIILVCPRSLPLYAVDSTTLTWVPAEPML